MRSILALALTAAFTLMCACDNNSTSSTAGPAAGTPALQILTTTLPIVSAGLPYSTTISAEGGTGEGYTWAVVAGHLPAPLVLASSQTSSTTISGTFSGQDGHYYFTIQVEDSGGNRATAAYTLTVLPAPPPPAPMIFVATLPYGVVGTHYSHPVQGPAGSSSYSWSLRSGSLPGGLSLQSTQSQDVIITGTPTDFGVFNFVLYVASQLAHEEHVLTLEVYAPMPLPPTVPWSRQYLYVCEVSAATAGAVNANLRAELIATIQGLYTYEEFDIMVYGSALASGRQYLWGSRLPATPANVAAAVAWINSPVFDPVGTVGTLMYSAWEEAYASQGLEYLICFYHDVGSNAPSLLANMGNWSAAHAGVSFVAAAFSPSVSSAAFGQNAAFLTGGTYIAV